MLGRTSQMPRDFRGAIFAVRVRPETVQSAEINLYRATRTMAGLKIRSPSL